jgi:hypothetical protein
MASGDAGVAAPIAGLACPADRPVVQTSPVIDANDQRNGVPVARSRRAQFTATAEIAADDSDHSFKFHARCFVVKRTS